MLSGNNRHACVKSLHGLKKQQSEGSPIFHILSKFKLLEKFYIVLRIYAQSDVSYNNTFHVCVAIPIHN